VETLITTGPVNLGGGNRKEESHKSREIAFEHLFPGAVIVCHRRAALPWVRTLGHATECSRTWYWRTRAQRCRRDRRWYVIRDAQATRHEALCTTASTDRPVLCCYWFACGMCLLRVLLLA